MDRWKAEQGRGREKRKIRRKKMQVREKVGKSRNTVFFRGFVAPEGWKVGSLKRRVRRHLGRWEMKSCTPLWREAHFWSQNVQNTPFSDHFWKLRCRKSARRCGAKHISKSKCTKHTRFGPLLEVEMSKKCTPLWREAHFEVKMYKTHQVRTTFGSWDVEKVHAVVARSTFRSQNVQNTHVRATFGGSDVEKVHAVVARSTFRSQNVQNTPCSRPLLEVQMSKKCTPLWREAHFEVKMLKTPGVRTTFGGSDVASLTTLHYITLHYTPLHYAPLHYTTLHNTTTTTTQLHSTTLHYTKLHYTTTTLHYTTLHYTTLHTPLHFTTLHYTPLHYTTTTTTQLHSTTIHSTTLHYTKLHYTTLHYTTLHSTTLHYITLHCTTFHYTSLHYTTLHYTTLQLQLRLHNYTPLHSTTHYTTLHYITLHYTPLHYTTLHYTTLHWMTLHHR